MSKRIILVATLVAALGLAFSPSIVIAEDHEKSEVMADAKTFADAMTEIDEHQAAIAKLIEAGKLDNVHKEAAHIQHHALSLAKLAMAADSGVPKDNIKDINLTGKELAGKFDAIDAAADAGKKPETKAVYEDMGKLIAKLKLLSKAASK